MKEHPILFNTEMVKAILDGRKTQTRRIIKNIPSFLNVEMDKDYRAVFYENVWKIRHMLCPYGKIGDRLWVRETWCDYIPQKKQVSNNYRGDDRQVIYKASHKMADMEGFEDMVLEQDIKWKPSIFMPRWVSRINLEITDIRVERVLDISEEDAKSEGVNRFEGKDTYSYAVSFAGLWDSINAKRGYGWEINPWVWIIVFKII